MDSEAINLVKTSCSDLIYFTKFKYLYKSYSLERLKAFLQSIFKNTINDSIATMAMTTLSLRKLQISLTFVTGLSQIIFSSLTIIQHPVTRSNSNQSGLFTPCIEMQPLCRRTRLHTVNYYLANT